MEHKLHLEMIKQGETLAIAESCTGGLLTAKLTQFSGASRYLLAGLVTYSNRAKETFLGVSQELLEQKGAVSQEVVDAMARGLLERTDADFVIAVSGVAGPDGGTKEKPVGTIFGALGKRGEAIFSGKIPLQVGSRIENQERASLYMLEALLNKLLHNQNPSYDH